MEKPSASFFLMDFVLLFVGIGFIVSVFKLTGYFFVLQLVMLLVFMGIVIYAMVEAFHNKSNAWITICATLVLIALDIFFIWVMVGQFGISNFVTLLTSLVGIAIGIMNISFTEPLKKVEIIDEYYPTDKPHEKHDMKKDIKNEVQKESEHVKKELKDELKDELKEELKEEKMEKTFVPGKYIASRKANKFHSPKCDFANRIKRGNEIWFQSRKEAEEQGFEADECV